MTDVDAKPIEALARRLGVEPRQLVLAAARLAREDVSATRVDAVLATARRPSTAARHVAELMATPVAGFALDDVDRALAATWPHRPT